MECDTCKHDPEPWDSEACDGCCKAHSSYEPVSILPQEEIDGDMTAEEGIKLGELFVEGFRKGMEDGKSKYF